MRSLRVGVVGRRGLSYVAGIRSQAGLSVDCFADLDAEARAHAASEHAIANCIGTLEEMIGQVDAVVIGTPMDLHAPQSLQALKLGKYVLSEVTAAVTVEECRALLAADPTSSRYMFAENYCYFWENLAVLELAREGRFGEPYFAEGEYIHEVRFLHRAVDGEPTWRMRWQVGQPGNTYCTHELGPLMRWFRAIEPRVRIVSVACFGAGVHTDPTLNHDDATLTMVKLSNGALLKLHLDMVSNRPHRIGYSLQGTLGVYESSPEPRVWFGPNKTVGWHDEERKWTPLITSDLDPPLRSEVDEAADYGHGGGDYLIGKRFAQSIILWKASRNRSSRWNRVDDGRPPLPTIDRRGLEGDRDARLGLRVAINLSKSRFSRYLPKPASLR